MPLPAPTKTVRVCSQLNFIWLLLPPPLLPAGTRSTPTEGFCAAACCVFCECSGWWLRQLFWLACAGSPPSPGACTMGWSVLLAR